MALLTGAVKDMRQNLLLYYFASDFPVEVTTKYLCITLTLLRKPSKASMTSWSRFLGAMRC
jgi:hypothetical protein